jgi:hypothetical protein
MTSIEDRRAAQLGTVGVLLRLIAAGEVSSIGDDHWTVYDDTIPCGHRVDGVWRLIERKLAVAEGYYEVLLTDAGREMLAGALRRDVQAAAVAGDPGAVVDLAAQIWGGLLGTAPEVGPVEALVAARQIVPGWVSGIDASAAVVLPPKPDPMDAVTMYQLAMSMATEAYKLMRAKVRRDDPDLTDDEVEAMAEGLLEGRA